LRRANVSVSFGLLLLSIFLMASMTFIPLLHAQAPTAAAPVMVRILEAVDSGNDPAGKQYRARINKAVDAGNGITIPQGASAFVTLAKDGSGFSAHLASVTINGQIVAVASGPASVTSGLQGAATSAMNSVSSMLGGFGHHPSTPRGVTAVAMGQRVVLPPGITLSFVLSQPPVANPAPPAASAAQSITASTPPASVGAGISAPGASNPTTMNPPVSAGAFAAGIQETLLGPRKQAAMFVVSPDGGHYAAPAMHGSREVVVIDGVDGPEFDHAAHTWSGEAIDLVFSSDGKHSAYVAQSGDDLVEVVDGKQAFTIISVALLPNQQPTGSVPKIDQRHIHNPGYFQLGGAGYAAGGVGHQCLISPSGAHVAVVAHMGNAGESGGFHMFLDGVKSPAYNFIDVSQVAFVAEKLIYIAQSNDHKWHVVVNDKSGPAYDGAKNLLVNDDNSHYAFIGAVDGSGWAVGVDGILGAPRGNIAKMVIASNGRVAYATEARVNGATATQVGSSGLYVDDQNLGPVAMPFAMVDSSGHGSDVEPYVLFSPDGKRFAYTRQVPGGFAVVIDGKVGRPYDGIGVFQFSPASKHYFYVGNRNSAFLVYDGQEMPGEDSNGVSNFVFSQTGGRLAHLAKSAQAGTRVIVDGKSSPPFKGGLVAQSMSFSQDGKHYAYATTLGYPPSQIVRDGVATNVPSLINFTTRTGPPHIDFPPLFFSGDGTRLAWGSPKSDGVSKDVISIDGQEIIRGYSMYEFPEFSPDSKHFAAMIWNANKYSLSMDGRIGPAYDDFLEVNPNVARFLDSHTFRFLGVKNGSVYRVTVNLGG
jgi:hypothetical protein